MRRLFVQIFTFYFLVSIGLYAENNSQKDLIEVKRDIVFENIYSGQRVIRTVPIKNISKSDVMIKVIKTSCGCTKGVVNQKKISPGRTVDLKVTLSTSGKSGFISKSLRIYLENQKRFYKVSISGVVKKLPGKHMAMTESIFKGKCISCHVTPTLNKEGRELYLGACATCHGIFREGHSALKLKDTKHSEKILKLIIQNGNDAGMPGFGKSKQGPLSYNQIDSLTHFLKQDTKLKYLSKAEDIYTRECRVCHGKEREGGIAPSLKTDEMKLIGKHKLNQILSEGMPKTLMKPFHKDKGGTLDEKQIESLVEFLLK